MNQEALCIKRTLQEIEFSIVEIGLYLDSHPCCTEALEYFVSLLDKHDLIKEQYEAIAGPLTVHAARSGECFSWVSAPWPWETEAN